MASITPTCPTTAPSPPASLDGEAAAAGCFVLSGVSSVPAISAAAVAALSEGLSAIISIETAILPGNRAPRGRSVIASILGQAGAPLMLWRGGQWRRHRGWTEPRRIVLAPGLARWASLIGAPDLTLFPSAFGARSVMFRAGLELGVMHWGLAFLAVLRRIGLLRNLQAWIGGLMWLAKRLERFGTDRGGMTVDLVGIASGRTVLRRWSLVADAGAGTFIPGIPAVAIARKWPEIGPGARPCVGELSLTEIEAALARLPVSTTRQEEPAPTLFERMLGDRTASLPASLRRLHSVQDVESFSGTAAVTRGAGWMARLAAWLFGFPKAGATVPVTVTKRRTPHGEIWQRDFAGSVFRSRLTPSDRPFRCRERFFPFTFELELEIRGASLHLPVRRGWLFGIPLPPALLPRSDSREFDESGAFHFDVKLDAPLGGGLIVRYRGHLTPDIEDEPAVTSAAAPERSACGA
jgi:hypothetical protein